MTGEMSWVKSNGEASDGSVYSVHAKKRRIIADLTECVGTDR